MSWFAKNYEKAALGGAVAVALGVSYMGWSKYQSVEEDFGTGLKGEGNNNTAIRDADLIPNALASIKLDRTWVQARDGDRPVDLFTGIPLFVSSADQEKPIDLIKDAPIHPPIPNIWWIENRIDPGFADSPNRDPDADGFSNIEEFNAKTDPNDSKSVPALIAKLKYIRDESLTWVLIPRFGSGGAFPFNYEDSKGDTNKVSPSEMVPPGGMFFSKGPMANRFKLVGSEERKEKSKSAGYDREITIVTIEDQRPNKKGITYEFPAPLQLERVKEHLKYDRTAVLSLEALGLEGKEIKVEENTSFALPPTAPAKDYHVKTVTPELITVEYADASGARKTVEISKGNFPRMEP